MVSSVSGKGFSFRIYVDRCFIELAASQRSSCINETRRYSTGRSTLSKYLGDVVTGSRPKNLPATAHSIHGPRRSDRCPINCEGLGPRWSNVKVA
jgi:hypothetical protein